MSKTQAILSATLPIVPILVPLGVHFVLVSFVLLSVGWLPATYFFCHIVLVLVGLWACKDNTSILAVIAFIFVVAITMLMDIIQLGIYFGPAQDVYGDGGSTTARTWQFSAGMSIINLLFKPVTIALACIAVYVRAGGKLGPLTPDADSYNTIHGNDEQQQN